ncbi:hypothetical protein EGH21_17305 [Halomicroarcula sp. F13]|uniref:Uncharacterized protein n=1 Tax=Haloarcula rubra TaxID=2487747 RepID=A0AAW4PUB5_9EURY|nr:hypothetical protein [Halomicroarcula rubra]MBX0324786.1 hypothetical protein [Halomicroarcula rubra]
MTVFGRLGALFVVLNGAALLLVDALRSPPGLWYAAIGIVAGTTMMAYTVISSTFRRRPQPAPEPTYSSTSNKSTTASTTQQTDSQAVEPPQTAESPKSTDQERVLESNDNTDPPESPTSEEKPEPSLTTVKDPQRLLKKTQTTERTASYTNSSRTKKTAGTSFRQNRHVTSSVSPRRSPSTETDNQYFKPVDSSHEIKFAQIDTRFSYLDIDWGPEFIGFDPIPDLVEVDVGPSVVSHELVRSPVEIKISSFLKTLLALTPRSSGTATPDVGTQPSVAAYNHVRRRTDDTATSQKSVPRDTYETRYSDQDRRLDSRREPMTAADRRQHPAETWPRSSPEPGYQRPTTADTTGYGSHEELGTFDSRRSSDRRSLGFEPVIREEPIGPQEVGVAGNPAVDMDMNHSLPRREPPQSDADTFGLNDVAPGFSEPAESVMDPIEQPALGFGMSDWEPGMLIDEPMVDPEVGAEMLGLDEFAESSEGAVGLPGSDVENGSNPLFLESECLFPEPDAADDWLGF